MKRLSAAAGPAAGILIGLWLTRHAWGGRPPSGDDVMALVVRAREGSRLALGGHVDGWSPRFVLGYEQFLYYGPGFSWAVGLVRLATAGLLSTAGAVKVVSVGAYIAIAPAAAFLALSFGLSRRAANAAAVLALAVNNVFGLGLAGTFVIGLVPHQLAATGFCVGLGAALRTTVDARRRWPALLALAGAALVVTHPISTAVLGLFFLVALPTLRISDRISRAALVRLAAAAGGALALSGFWIVPYVAHFGDRGEVPTWATPPVGDRLQEILDGHLLFGPYLGWLVVAGVAFAGARAGRRHRWSASLVAIPVLFFVVSHTMASRWPGFDLSPQLANRGLGYAGLVAILSLAALVAWVTSPLRSLGGIAADAAATALAAALVLLLPAHLDAVAGQQPDPSPDLRAAAVALHRLVPASARFVTERDYPAEIGRTGVTHPDFWLAASSRRNTLNAFGLEISPSPAAAGVAEAVGSTPPRRLARSLARLGVTHAVTTKEATANAFDAEPLLRRVWRQGELSVYAVLPGPGQPPVRTLLRVVDGPAQAVVREATPEHLVIDVLTAVPTRATIAVGWSSKWHARVEGRSQRLTRTPDGAMALQLPIGESRLELRFERDVWDLLGALLSFLALAGGSVWFLQRRGVVAAVRRAV